MNKRHYEHTLPNIRGSLSNTYLVPVQPFIKFAQCLASISPDLEFGHHFFQCAADQRKGHLPFAVSRLLKSLVKILHVPSDKEFGSIVRNLVFLPVGIQEHGTGPYQRYGSLALPISQHLQSGFPYPLGKQAVVTVTGYQTETVRPPVTKDIHRVYDQRNIRRVLSGSMGGSLYKPESMLPGSFLPRGKRFPRPVSINSSHDGIPITGNKAHYILHLLKGGVIPVNKDRNGISGIGICLHNNRL